MVTTDLVELLMGKLEELQERRAHTKRDLEITKAQLSQLQTAIDGLDALINIELGKAPNTVVGQARERPIGKPPNTARSGPPEHVKKRRFDKKLPLHDISSEAVKSAYHP